jgi:hypothetical protein
MHMSKDRKTPARPRQKPTAQQVLEEITNALLQQETGSEAVAVAVVSVARTTVTMPDTLVDRFKDAVLVKPFGPVEVKKLVDMLIDKHEQVPADRKEEAKALLNEMVEQGVYDETKGLRSLRPIVKAIAEISLAPDMREALAVKYPVFTRRISVNSGERLAEAFTTGTAARTGVRKPVRLKSRGVGFFSLN